MQNKYFSVHSRLDRNFISFLLDTVDDKRYNDRNFISFLLDTVDNKRYDVKGSDFDVNLFNYLIGVGQ